MKLTEKEFLALVTIMDSVTHEHFYTMYNVGTEAGIINDFIERHSIEDQEITTILNDDDDDMEFQFHSPDLFKM